MARVPDGFRPAWLRAQEIRQSLRNQRDTLRAMGIRIISGPDDVAPRPKVLNLIEETVMEARNTQSMSIAHLEVG